MALHGPHRAHEHTEAQTVVQCDDANTGWDRSLRLPRYRDRDRLRGHGDASLRLRCRRSVGVRRPWQLNEGTLPAAARMLIVRGAAPDTPSGACALLQRFGGNAHDFVSPAR